MKVFFPYEKLRSEQKQLIEDITKAVGENKVFFIHAPTGLGKTVSSLAPAMSYALENKKKVFFLTPKIAQHEIVLETAKLMNEKFGLKIKVIDFVGRKNMCADDFMARIRSGFYETCSKRKKNRMCLHYNNTKGFSLKQKADAAKRKKEVLEMYCRPHLEMKELCSSKELCPYEVTLEMAKKADLIIGDYFHLFNDEIREGILAPSGITLSDCIIIVDEAHNLPHRLRDMLASSLEEDSIEKAGKEAKSLGDYETEFLMKDIGKEISSFGKKLSLEKSEAVLIAEDLDMLKKIAKNNIEKIAETASKFITKNKTESSFLLGSAVFLNDLLKEKEHTLHVIERRKGLRISIYPLDASEMASNTLNNCHSAVLMSGTLLPLEMHADVLGVDKKRVLTAEYKCPFPIENRLNLFVDKTTTKYASRSTAQFEEQAEIISKIISKVPGNTIVFFPSFELLELLRHKIKSSRKILIQEREMNSEEKAKLIKDFKLLGNGFGGVLLAVSGGSIAEGIDFPGENLLCAIIVGIPFAKVSIYSDALIKFYEQKFKKGWEYAYNAPAIGKAIQAAGRVIRTEKDLGVCVFLDSRFSEERYKKFYPKDFAVKKTLEPEKEVEQFFKQN